MIVPIKRDGKIEEWAIVELQGDLIFHSPGVTNQHIGDLHLSKSGTPILIIGMHVLHGKEMPFPKPYAVLVRKNSEKDNVEHTSELKTEYIVKAIVKKRLIFNTRPKAIIKPVPKRT
ncbi:chromosome transmission fidelity protein 8 homolog [Osmia lignaria lignaria]|uniref:chromosome transmission fidelity protein 8 homolog n=1 Tax=Osmia lignaria lignaria TaxID=1437193 RepID=UPI00402B89EC